MKWYQIPGKAIRREIDSNELAADPAMLKLIRGIKCWLGLGLGGSRVIGPLE